MMVSGLGYIGAGRGIRLRWEWVVLVLGGGFIGAKSEIWW